MSVYESIIAGLNEAIAYETTEAPARKVKCTVAPIPTFAADEIKGIRNDMGMTQETFAAVVGVSKKTVEAWEAGTNAPIGSACRLIGMLKNDPTIPSRYRIITV